jgi:hypothetical protein
VGSAAAVVLEITASEALGPSFLGGVVELVRLVVTEAEAAEAALEVEVGAAADDARDVVEDAAAEAALDVEAGAEEALAAFEVEAAVEAAADELGGLALMPSFFGSTA